jgi:hypothetical protein
MIGDDNMTRVIEISKFDDMIDVRDVIERFEQLEEERDGPLETLKEAREALDNFDPSEGGGDEAELQQDAANAERDYQGWHDNNGTELEHLQGLLDDLRGNGGDERWRGDWYPVTLIRDSHFVEAMQELVSDIGDLPRDIPSYLEIDWDATARNLRVDYSSVEFDGVTYWYR